MLHLNVTGNTKYLGNMQIHTGRTKTKAAECCGDSTVMDAVAATSPFQSRRIITAAVVSQFSAVVCSHRAKQLRCKDEPAVFHTESQPCGS